MNRILLVVALSCITTAPAFVQHIDGFQKTADDDDRKYTNTGSIGLTVSNFGTIGHGFNYWPSQPSCEYPKGSGVEHLFVGGLWIGGYRLQQVSVTTGAVDISRVFDIASGFEYTNAIGTQVTQRSSLLDDPFFSLNGVSHQDFVADYVDSNLTIPGTSTPIPDHIYPLYVAVHQESYAWNFPFAENFVLLSYTITNVGVDTLDSVYVGLWTDTVVRNTRLTGRPSGTAFYSSAGNGWVDSMHMHYTFDFGDGLYPPSSSYIVIKLLGTTPLQRLQGVVPDSLGVNRMFNSWFFRNNTDPVYFAPADDPARYEKMKNPLTPGQIAPLRLTAGNRMTLISTGPFSRISPGDSVNVALAVICASKNDDGIPAGHDSLSSRANLYASVRLAQQAYNGEDRNGNGIQDANEVWTGPNGRPRRYFLPEPPSVPKLRVEPADRKATLYWDGSAEESIDPISNVRDFEGYRLYRTNPGQDLDPEFDPSSSLILVAELDLRTR